MKKEKSKLSERVEIRMSPYEKNFIRGLADIYAGGNMSLLLVYAALNCDRKFLSENELLESDRRIIKGKNRKGSFLAPPSKDNGKNN